MAGASTAQRSEVSQRVAAESPDQLRGTIVEVGDELIPIGKLSLTQWIGLTRIGAEFVQKVDPAQITRISTLIDSVSPADEDSEVAVASDAATPTVDYAALLQILLDVLDDAIITKLFGIIVDRPTAWVDKHFDPVEFIHVFEALFEHNDPKRIWAAFSQAAERWRPTSSTN
jgi:hypothetical protein